METVQHFKAMEAFCRQRAKMDREDEAFWLAEADALGKLIANMEERKKGPPLLEAS
jgi:hypothetical protein